MVIVLSYHFVFFQFDKNTLTDQALELLSVVPEGYIPLPHQIGGHRHVDGKLGEGGRGEGVEGGKWSGGREWRGGEGREEGSGREGVEWREGVEGRGGKGGEKNEGERKKGKSKDNSSVNQNPLLFLL